MKFLATVLLFLGLHANAAKVCNQEAQFIGTYANVTRSDSEAGNIEHTTYKIKFSLYQSSGVCPLDKNLAESFQFYVQGTPANIQEGNQVSGVLVYNTENNQFWIE